MKTQKYTLSAQGDAQYDDFRPESILVDIESVTREAKKMHNALILANCSSIKSDHFGLIAEYDESDEETDSPYEYGLTVSSDGSIGITGQNKHNGASSLFVSLDFKVQDSKGKVTYMLKDGDNLKKIHVAMNGNFGNDDSILIWEANTFGGSGDAPIAIVNNDGKLEIRYWQPEDMGCNPTSVTVIKPYGIYDMNLKPGVELDNIDLSLIEDDCETVAMAKIDERGKTYDIKAYVIRTSDGGFGFDIFRHGELVTSSDADARYCSVRDCFFAVLNQGVRSMIVAEEFKEYKETHTIVCWPESQRFMERDGFKEEAILINSELASEIYGSSAYLVPNGWVYEAEQATYLPDTDQKVYCESCKMDVAFDEIGNCMNCGMPVDDWNQLEEDGEIPFIPEGAQRGGIRPAPMEDYIQSIEEFCPHCGLEATLKNEFHAQACSECGEMILPCSICQSNIDGDTDACINCPIEHTKISAQKEEV
ncbi:MAG: hypothetical protein WCT07_03085 [Candidatus Paceibacterota bacterium]